MEAQSKTRGLGQQLLAVAVDAHSGRTYRSPIARDFKACALAEARLRELSTPGTIPSEPLPYLRSIFNVHVYGLQEWSALFSPRQLLYLTTLVRLVTTAPLAKSGLPEREQVALRALLALAASKSAMLNCNVARWRGDKGRLEGAFAMQALPMVWDWGELNPLNRRMMPFGDLVEAIAKVVDQVARAATNTGTVAFGSATALPLPDDCAAAFITDPPYYDSIPYANLSDFPFVWLKRLLRSDYPALFSLAETPKTDEIVQLAERNVLYAHKTREFFENSMEQALAEARRIAQPSGIACIVFAHKTTVGWEALVNAVLRSGWTVTASWPIDTELTTRFKAIGTASLSSSIHLLCRPRENLEDSGGGDRIGNWRDVLGELPQRIHEWMPRLAEEGVVGADAIFACLGPALEIFSRYLRVEKASGEVVALKEYLEQVWAAVAKEALTMVFAGADATGFEPGARLTAMWLWTLSAGKPGSADGGDSESDEESDDEVDGSSKKTKMIGFVLEYDAARKIAQGLGANLEGLESLVEVSGETARLLAVGERIDYLFRKDPVGGVEGRRTRTKKPRQGSLFEEVEASEMGDGVAGGGIERSRAETTILDRVHQSMILFGAGRGEALKRFLIEDGVGMDARFWRLADALAALYPRGTDERRWVEGVLARKKGLGF